MAVPKVTRLGIRPEVPGERLWKQALKNRSRQLCWRAPCSSESYRETEVAD
jgi:hypothetical protein